MNSRLAPALLCFCTLTIGYIPHALTQSKPATVKTTNNSAQAKFYDDHAMVKFRANNITGALADLACRREAPRSTASVIVGMKAE